MIKVPERALIEPGEEDQDWDGFECDYRRYGPLMSATLTHLIVGFLADAHDIEQSLKAVESFLIPLSENLVDTVWGAKRPSRPANKIIPLDVKYSGAKLFSHMCRLLGSTSSQVKVMKRSSRSFAKRSRRLRPRHSLSTCSTKSPGCSTFAGLTLTTIQVCCIYAYSDSQTHLLEQFSLHMRS